MLTERIAHELATAGRLADASPERSLDRMVAVATRVIPGCSAALITVWETTGEPLVTASHPGLDTLLRRQHDTGGPVYEARRTGRSVLINDTMRESRWPEYASTAVRLGVRSTLVLPVRVDASTITLALYGIQRNAFDERAITPYTSLLTEQAAALIGDQSSRPRA